MYECKDCGEQWEDGPHPCPKCGSHEHRVQGAATGSMLLGGTAKATVEQALDALRLTVLGLLVTLGVSAGLSVGFEIGGWRGIGAGVAAGLGLPFALALAFRNSHTRRHLAALADKAIGLR